MRPLPPRFSRRTFGALSTSLLLAATTRTHAENIDEVEGAPHQPGALRIALEVDDTEQAVAAAQAAGAELIAPPVKTPFQSLNARVQGPAGWQITFFQELETLEERAAREGFTTDDARKR